MDHEELHDYNEKDEDHEDTIDSPSPSSVIISSKDDGSPRELPPFAKLKKKGKGRLRTQSESAVWTRASFRMHTEDAEPHETRKSTDTSLLVHTKEHKHDETEEEELNDDFERMHLASRHSLPSLAPGEIEQEARTLANASMLETVPTKPTSIWLQQGRISKRASEILEDAKLSLHGKEKNLYMSSARRLSEAQDPVLNSLGEKMASKSSQLPTEQTPPQSTTESLSSIAPPAEFASPRSPSTSDMDSFVRPESATLYHEAVKWEGVLSKRSEWLRRLEKHYYVLEGKFLRRFASKEAYLASRDEPILRVKERPRRNSTPVNAVSHLYVIAGVKESTTRTNGFTLITEDKKTLQLQAPTPVEKVIWMRLSLEAIVAIPNLPVAPLDLEEFYAMLVVLYTAHRGNWKTDGDMAVTLPPPSEQVFTRFFRLLDKDIIFCSNYPPSVPFHGSYRGHAGLVRFMHEFSKHTVWTHFKIAGLSVEGALAVASGKEELENKRDGRKFIQNWVHKFTFYSDGRLARFEINGDVVAASAVFKVPGAATTLKLPQEFNEVDAEHGKAGTILVRVMQGHGLKNGTSQKKLLKEPSIALSITHREQPMGKPEPTCTPSSGLVAGLSMPSLTRKISSGINLLTTSGSSSSHAQTSHTEAVVKIPSNATGPPRDVHQPSFVPANPVWNKVISVPFANVIGTCSLVVELMDFAKGQELKIGYASVNIAKHIMSAHEDTSVKTVEEEAMMTAQSRWYTISNAKGEYCGKVLLGITCRRATDDQDDDDLDLAKPRLKKSRSVVIDHAHPPSTHMLQWEQTHALVDPSSTKSLENQPLSSIKSDSSSGCDSQRRHGWTTVKLSPESLVRTQSDGATTTVPNPSTLPTSSDAVVCQENANMHTFMVCGAPFTIPRHYQLIKVCGRGAYGIVIAATNLLTGGNVAIKKVIDCIWHPHQLKQILREVRLIRHMAHDNILSLMDLIPPSSYHDFRDVYMTVDLMEMDLHRIIYSKEVLLDDHIRYFLYQILSGLHHMHKAGVLHRDLKPSNLLINSDCQLKICDLGLARSKDVEDIGMTEYVVTRWYRAPELLLGSAYNEGVDLWAAGCIFAEMLGRKPLFPGETYVHQLQLIMNVLGVPEEHSFKENPQANKLKGRQLLSRTQAVPGMDLTTLFPNANPEALDLLWKMLVFDVEKRISVHDALRHPYLAAYYDEDKETRPIERFQSFDLEGLDENDLKELMFKEICHFHPEEMEKRAKQQAENPDGIEKLPPGWVKRESRSVPGKFYYSNPKRGISTWIKEEMETL